MLSISRKHVYYHYLGHDRPVSWKERVIIGLLYVIAAVTLWHSADWIFGQLIGVLYAVVLQGR